MSPNRLEPLWMERLEESRFFDDLDLIGLGRLTWASLMNEADAMRSRYEAGEPWPPREVVDHIVPPQGSMFARELPARFDPESFLGFFSLPTILAGIHAMERALRVLGATESFMNSALATTVHELYHLTRFRHYGKKVYALDMQTYELLLQTDLPDMPLRYLRPPIPEFYLVLPEGHNLTVEAAGDVQPIEGVMVSFPDVEDALYSSEARELSLLVVGKSPRGVADDNLNFLSGAIRADTSIRNVAVHEVHGERGPFRDLLHVLLGTVLYLASEHPMLEPVPPVVVNLDAIKNPRKRAKAEKRLGRYTRLAYVCIRSELDIPSAAPVSDSAHSIGRRLDHTVWVRGHWRNQPYGEGRTQRKWIWIRPHTRGPDMAESMRIQVSRIRPARSKKRKW